MSSDSDRAARVALHVLTRPGDSLAQATVACADRAAGQAVRVIDLTVAEPDYEALLDAIFAADSVVVW